MKVLIVDDNHNDRMLLRYVVEKNGGEAIEAEDGAEGLRVATSIMPDLIISDALMPVTDGFQFLRSIKKDPGLRDIPFIFCSSSYTEDQDVRLALSLGADAYLFKPVDPLELWGNIMRVLEKERPDRHPSDTLLEEDADYLKSYSAVVATKLEEKVRELECALAERKAAEAALREMERELRTLVENIPDCIARFDRDHRFLFVNPALARAFGGSPESFLSKSLGESGMSGDDAQNRLLEEKIGQAFADSIANTVEAKWVTSEGLRFFDILHVPERDESGNIVSVLAIARDITERKCAEEAVRNLNQELDRRVRDRTKQLEAANHELEAFAYSVSHDLRAPLQGIDGFSLILLDDYSTVLDDTGKDFLRRIRACTQRMAQLIDDILSLSLISRGEMQMEKVRLSGLVQEIATELAEREPARETVFVTAPDVVVTGDPRFLRVALENLLGNAWKFTSGCTAARIEFGVFEQEGQPVYFVRDNGAGFDMKYASRLFGAFQRLHSTSEFPGTGIGLATVQRIIHRHGGRVWAEGKVNQGATIFFTLS